MKYRFSAVWIKGMAFFLAAVSLVVGFLSGFATAWCVSQGYYDPNATFQTTWYCKQLAESQQWTIIEKFRRDPDYAKWDRLMEDSNLRFIILDERTGDVKASWLKGLGIAEPNNLRDNIYLDQHNYYFSLGEKGSIFENLYVSDFYFGPDWSGDSSYWEEQQWIAAQQTDVEPVETPMVEYTIAEDFESYQLLLLLPESIVKRGDGDSIYEGWRVYRTFRSQQQLAPVVFAACAVVFLACAVFLCCQAGHKPGLETPRTTWFERIPLELQWTVAGFALFAGYQLLHVCYNATNVPGNTLRELEVIYGFCSAGAVICGLAVLGVLVSLAARVKQGKWWNGFLCWRVVSCCCRWFFEIVVQGVRSIGMVPRAFLLILAILLVEFLGLVWLVNTWEPVFPVVLLVVFNLFLLLALIWALAQMRILQKAAKALADGDLDHQLDTSRMYWDFKEHGDHLNAIAGGLSKAVDKQMRSERLKTELITNVSHDIKTPLTSIVNYVDLLQKPHTEAEGIQYLEVLDRQSKRLKKLTENLVEASKASTGNMAVHPEPLSVMELVNQSVEEYRERLEAGKLETVVSLRGDLQVLADGKLMWRIMDNLLNNVIKYALPGTRVYVTAQKWGERVVIAVKNISRDPLNVDADELMERFVRGDSSRHTEGAGLGLNIVRSLTQLQNGQFTLTVDGDFFKAEVSLPTA